jgi:chorismate lyase/3-hydroxybenzoate synthase
MNGEYLIGSIAFDEHPDTCLDTLTYQGYRDIMGHLQDSGYPYLWRLWNYFPRINDDQAGLERYRRFCVGRHQALTELLPGFPYSVPAATAVGTRSGPLRIMFLAGTKPAEHLGNPRQLHAYDYPSEYGPRSPSFARATLFRSDRERSLFVAGTASVVGHASRHIGLPGEQTRESIHNLRTVLEHAGAVGGIDFLDRPDRALYKVYVRDAGSLPEIREVLRQSPLSACRLLYLQGDLCRKELLVEIEGLVTSE